jgi:hypothetical protein
MKRTSMTKCAIWSRSYGGGDSFCNLPADFFQEEVNEPSWEVDS